MTEANLVGFDTAIGRCAIGWRGDRISAVRLPGGDYEPGALPDFVVQIVAAIRSLLAGEDVDLGWVPVDYGAASPFECDVWEACRRIARGRALTYGALAEAAGHPGSARAVGVALGRNPVPIVVPCHRVLASGGRSGGFSAPGGLDTKFRLLEIEQARPESAPMLFEALPLAIRC